MTRPVKSIPPNPQVFIHPVRDRIRIGVLRHRLVKRRVEHRHLDRLRKPVHRRADALQIRQVVKRGELPTPVDRRQHLLVDQSTLHEFLTPVHYTVSHRNHFLDTADHPHTRIHQRLLDRR